MRKWVNKAVFGVCLAAALAFPAVSSAASTSAAGHLRIATSSNPDFSNLTQTAQRHKVVILQPWETDELHQIKAADPNTIVICHKNLSGASTLEDSSGLYSTGVSYKEADASHPDWFLTDSNDNRITFKGYSYLYGMDVGNPDYQRTWADHVINELTQNGWDGVELDNVDTTMKYDFNNYPTQYPTDSAWQKATESAVANIGPRIQAAGKIAIANIGGWGGNPTVGRSWLQYVNGGMDEMFAKWTTTAGTGYADPNRWAAALDSLKYAQQHGKYFLAVTHSSSTDEQAAVYGWATVLLGADGKAAYTMAPDYNQEAWFPEYDYNIGDPTGSESVDPNGVHRRVFQNGIVVVNPTTSQLSADLHGTYSGSGLTNVKSVTLPAHSAYVLTGTADGGGSGGSGGGSVPANTSLPTISGIAQDGNALSSSNGSWSGSPTSYAYQWRRCDTSGSNCAEIVGANSSTYQLTSADVGSTIRVAVRASNSYGSASATSNATATVAAATPTVIKVVGKGKGGSPPGKAKVKGAVSLRSPIASTRRPRLRGAVEMKLYRRFGGKWHAISRTRRSRLTAHGKFHKRLRTFRHHRVRPGTYCVKARYPGSRVARPSTSRSPKFKVRRSRRR